MIEVVEARNRGEHGDTEAVREVSGQRGDHGDTEAVREVSGQRGEHGDIDAVTEVICLDSSEDPLRKYQ